MKNTDAENFSMLPPDEYAGDVQRLSGEKVPTLFEV